MKQRNRRTMAMAGTAVFGGLVIGTVAAAAGGAPVTDDVSSGLHQPVAGNPGIRASAATGPVTIALPTDPAALSGLAEAVGVQTVTAAAEDDSVPVTIAVPTAAEATPQVPAAGPAQAALVAAPATDAPAAAQAPAPAQAAPAPEVTPAPEPAPELAPEPTPAPAPTGSVEEAIAAWFPDVYDEAIAVADCESSLNPAARSSGGANHGLFQINNVHRENFTAITGQPWDAVYDPYYNSQYARRLYDGRGWGPWTCKP